MNRSFRSRVAIAVRPVLVAALTMVVSQSVAHAACLTPNNVELELNLPDYLIWRIVSEEMKQCGNVKAEFDFDAALVTPDPAAPDRDLGSLVGISNASLHRLSRQNLLRPLDDLVEIHRDKLAERQLIRVNGKVVAIAIAGNTRALMVHRDLFTQESIAVPANYDELFGAAERLKGGTQLYSHSLTLAYKSGWNLTQEFIDQYLGASGQWLDDANRPQISGDLGAATLERIKKLASYLPPEYLEADAAKALDDLLKFNAPMSVLWVSSAGPLENPAVSRVAGKMSVLPAPAVVEGGKPASTLWWDGFAIPVSATNEQAEAAFVTALEGLDAEMLLTNRDNAFWLVKDYFPGRLTKDILAQIDKDNGQGIVHYPASEATDLLRRALGPQITEFMEGKKAAAAALADAEADYLKAAQERGLIGS